MMHTSSRLLFACCLSLGSASFVHAGEGDVFNLRATENILWDDNIFRTAHQPRAELVTTTILGVDFNKRLSLQQFDGHISWIDTRYQKYDYLNASTFHYDGSWRWAVGSHLTGELAADRSATQNSFADFDGLRERNLRVIESQRFGLDYAVTPSWHAIGGLSHQTIINDKSLPADNDIETSGVNLGVKYTPASGNWISLQTKKYDGKYLKRAFNGPTGYDNEFTQSGQEIAANWTLTGHSSLKGRLEYFQRKHAHLESQDYSGWMGQLSYIYLYSGKTTLSANYLRGLNTYQQAYSNYYTSDEVNFVAQWAATAKLSVAGKVAFSRRQYRGALPTYTGPQRDDDFTRVGLDMSYKTYRWLELKASLATEKRNSNISGQDYTDHQALVSANVLF